MQNMSQEPSIEEIESEAGKFTQEYSYLVTTAMDYRIKYENAKSNLSRELYKKKLMKIVRQLDAYTSVYSALSQQAKENGQTDSD